LIPANDTDVDASQSPKHVESPGMQLWDWTHSKSETQSARHPWSAMQQLVVTHVLQAVVMGVTKASAVPHPRIPELEPLPEPPLLPELEPPVSPAGPVGFEHAASGRAMQSPSSGGCDVCRDEQAAKNVASTASVVPVAFIVC
jgi:hypothetical protein